MKTGESRKRSVAKGIGLAAIMASVVLFAVPFLPPPPCIRTTQPNGLAQIVCPFGGLAPIEYLAAGGFLVFGLLVTFMNTGGRAYRSSLLGGGAIAIGLVAVLFAALLLWIDSGEYGIRCISGSCNDFLTWDAQRLAYLIPILLVGLMLIPLGIRRLLSKVCSS
jgi:hypothetical protein